MRARKQLAPVLSRLQRAARMPLRHLGLRVGVSASYLSRVLAGQRFPSWEVTERLGRALGADVCTLRRIWEDEDRYLTVEKLHRKSRASTSLGKATPGADLASALSALHQRCGTPTARAIAIVLDHALTPEQISAALNGHTAARLAIHRTARASPSGRPRDLLPAVAGQCHPGRVDLVNRGAFAPPARPRAGRHPRQPTHRHLRHLRSHPQRTTSRPHTYLTTARTCRQETWKGPGHGVLDAVRQTARTA
ncbi:helix-turn-helix domain-containing protein (plasmid) [Streptomyces sp. NBC_01795]|uniref:helix-turn-helix domain-containing protein n=1 Tax=Streptomyces sp. NBC_01795 TaxID=2975943 RepID=UPI002DDA3A66|nr:helix-turn-helix transcriptional regulator [Streptomyces sp. NBC_01795]WSA97788.1 helix-turn-helix domain-containing protein [Streptomyces sp. NBC_01795]